MPVLITPASSKTLQPNQLPTLPQSRCSRNVSLLGGIFSHLSLLGHSTKTVKYPLFAADPQALKDKWRCQKHKNEKLQINLTNL